MSILQLYKKILLNGPRPESVGCQQDSILYPDKYMIILTPMSATQHFETTEVQKNRFDPSFRVFFYTKQPRTAKFTKPQTFSAIMWDGEVEYNVKAWRTYTSQVTSGRGSPVTLHVNSKGCSSITVCTQVQLFKLFMWQSLQKDHPECILFFHLVGLSRLHIHF